MSEIVPRPDASVEVDREQIIEVYESANAIVADLQLALALIQKYQWALNMVGCPDPEILTANDLLRRHGLPVERLKHFFKVYTDGVDITEHADSLEGEAEEIEAKELESGD